MSSEKISQIKELLMQEKATELAIEHIDSILTRTENFLKYVELVKENFDITMKMRRPHDVFFAAARDLLWTREQLENQKNEISSKIECIFHKCIDSRFKKYSSLSSLLIRGIPGSGKTLMTLSLASHHQGDFFYVSTRVSPEDIFETYPWFREEIKKLRVLDASRELSMVDATKRIFERAEDDVSSIIFFLRLFRSTSEGRF